METEKIQLAKLILSNLFESSEQFCNKHNILRKTWLDNSKSLKTLLAVGLWRDNKDATMSPGERRHLRKETGDTFCNRAYRGYNLCLGTIWISFKDVEETKQEIKL